MSFNSQHHEMEHPQPPHFSEERRPSVTRNFSVPIRASLPPLDVEAARAAERERSQKAWQGYQWSNDSWVETAVDTRSNSLDQYSRKSQDGWKSAVASVSELHVGSSSPGHSSFARGYATNEKTPTLPRPDTTDMPLSSPQQIALVMICCLAQFLNLAGMNQTVAPVMILSDYFHITDYGTLSWFSAAYSMSVGTFILPAGNVFAMPCMV